MKASYKILISLIFIVFTFNARAEIQAEDVASCMRANLPQRFSVEDFVLTSISRDGNKESISGQIYFTREARGGQESPARAMMRIEHPTPLRGSAYLLIETDDYDRDGMFVFLPALNRVRRVSGTMADGQLFGTDISYYDFKQFRNAMADMIAGELRRGVLDERPVYRLSFTPKPEVDAHYEHVDAIIDAESCLPRVLDIFEDGKLRKTFSIPLHAIKRDGERWYMDELTMQDRLRGSLTTMKTMGYSSTQALSDALFNPSTFHKAM